MKEPMEHVRFRWNGDLSGLRGDTLRAGIFDYDEARMLYNGMIDRRPAMIVRCAGPDDMIAA